MAKIADIKGRRQNSGYQRVVGNEVLGHLLSRVHATTISAGTELEKLITAMAGQKIDDLDEFLGRGKIPHGINVVPKGTLRKSRFASNKHSQGDEKAQDPDFLIFEQKSGGEPICHVVELKDGDAFDTKKSRGEGEAMKNFANRSAKEMPCLVKEHFCCFNQDSKRAIFEGFKKRIPEDKLMTGKELCELLDIDYREIIKIRQKDAKENFSYLIDELIKIPEVKDEIRKRKLVDF